LMCSAGSSASLRLSATAATDIANGAIYYGPVDQTEYVITPKVIGSGNFAGTLRASIAKESVSLTLTDALFSCPSGCGPSYGFQAILELPFGSLPAGPLGVTAHVSGTANFEFPAIVDISTFVGTLDDPTQITQHAIHSGPVSLNLPRPDVTLSYPADEQAYLLIGIFGLPGSYFQGDLLLPDSMTLTVTSLVPEPGTGVLVGLVLVGAGFSRSRFRARTNSME
jgi:hypothetical protein